MRTQVVQTADGLTVALPATLAAAAGLIAGDQAEVEFAGGRLVVGPILPAGAPASLAEMIAGITPENCHRLWDTGPPVGGELL